MTITRKQLQDVIIKEFKTLSEGTKRVPNEWKYDELPKDDFGELDLTVNYGDPWTIGPGNNDPYVYGDIITDVPGDLQNLQEMKITRRQLRRIIKEALEVHQVPVDLDTVDSEEAYGIGYMKGAEQDTNTDDDGCGGTVALSDDIDDAGPPTSQMPASWRQILGNILGEND